MSGDVLDFKAEELEEFIQRYMELDRGGAAAEGYFFRYFRGQGSGSINMRLRTSWIRRTRTGSGIHCLRRF